MRKHSYLLLILPLFLVSCGGWETASSSESAVSARLEMSETSLTLSEEKTYQLSATPTVEMEGTVEWTSSDSSIASVDQTGLVTAVKVGLTQIVASLGDLKAVCQVTVTQFVPDAALSLQLDKTSFVVDHTAADPYEIPFTVRYGEEYVTDYALSSEVADPTIASIEDGKITGLIEGSTTAILTVTYLEMTAQGGISITVI